MSIGDLLRLLLSYLRLAWPLAIVSQWEQGVRLLNGRTRKLLGPGLHWFVPVLGRIVSQDCTTAVYETDYQTVQTADGEDATFSLTVRYRTVDLKRQFETVYDAADSVGNLVQGIAAEACSTLDYECLAAELPGEVMARTESQLEAWGIELEEVHLANLTTAPALRLIAEGGGASIQINR